MNEIVVSVDENQDSRSLKGWLEKIALFSIIVSICLALPALSVNLGLGGEGDAVDYRVPLLKWMVRHHQYPVWSWSVVDDYPMLGELLMLPFFIIKESLARIVPIFAYIMSGFFAAKIFVKLAERISFPKRTLFLLAMAWALGLRTLAVQSNLLMVDNIASCFTLGAIYFLTQKRLNLAGFFAALALGTRYSAWPTVFAVLLSALVFVRSREFSMMKWIKLCFITALGAVPTVTRNCLANHNPIFPLAISLLGPAQTKIFADYVGYGVRLTPIELLKLPWTLLITSEFAKPIFDYTLGKVFLVQLLGLPFLIILNRKEKGAVLSLKRNSEMLFLIIFVALDFLIWIVTSQQLRFLVPAILIVQIFLLLRLLMMPLNKASFGTITFLTVAGVISNAAIHRNDLKENFLTPFNLAKPCMESADRNHLGPIAQLQRESSLGYFDNEFVFVGSHPYSVVSDQSRAEWPKYLFFTGVPREASTWGYYPVPAGDKISENCSFLYVNSNPALIPPIPSETVGK